MSARRTIGRLTGAALSAALALLLSGCGYDYLQHSDRVAYSAGDAVRANIEAETINPSKRSMYDTSGLARNGAILVPVATASPSNATPVTTSN